MLATEGVHISFSDEAVKELARIAAQVNEQVENIEQDDFTQLCHPF